MRLLNHTFFVYLKQNQFIIHFLLILAEGSFAVELSITHSGVKPMIAQAEFPIKTDFALFYGICFTGV